MASLLSPGTPHTDPVDLMAEMMMGRERRFSRAAPLASQGFSSSSLSGTFHPGASKPSDLHNILLLRQAQLIRRRALRALPSAALSTPTGNPLDLAASFLLAQKHMRLPPPIPTCGVPRGFSLLRGDGPRQASSNLVHRGMLYDMEAASLEAASLAAADSDLSSVLGAQAKDQASLSAVSSGFSKRLKTSDDQETSCNTGEQSSCEALPGLLTKLSVPPSELGTSEILSLLQQIDEQQLSLQLDSPRRQVRSMGGLAVASAKAASLTCASLDSDSAARSSSPSIPAMAVLGPEEKRQRRLEGNREAARRLRKRHADRIKEVRGEMEMVKRQHAETESKLEDALRKISELQAQNEKLQKEHLRVKVASQAPVTLADASDMLEDIWSADFF